MGARLELPPAPEGRQRVWVCPREAELGAGGRPEGVGLEPLAWVLQWLGQLMAVPRRR